MLNCMAKNKNEKAVRDRHDVSIVAMRSYAHVLRTLAESHENIADMMESTDVSKIKAGNLKTGLEGIYKLSSYLASATQSFLEHRTVRGIAEIEGAAQAFRIICRRTWEDLGESDDAPIFPAKLPGVGETGPKQTNAPVNSENLTSEKSEIENREETTRKKRKARPQ
jgi:hypothetical protein